METVFCYPSEVNVANEKCYLTQPEVTQIHPCLASVLASIISAGGMPEYHLGSGSVFWCDLKAYVVKL